MESCHIKVGRLGLSRDKKHGDGVQSLSRQRNMSDLLEHLCARRVSRSESFLDRSVVADDGVTQCSVEKRNRRIRAVSRTHETVGCHDDFVKDVGSNRDLVLVMAQHTGQNDVQDLTGLLASEFIDDDG